MYKYFCNYCGHRFESDLPERNENGFLNDLYCPKCGDMDVYPDTPEGAAASVKATMDDENTLLAWDDEED